MTQAPSPSVLIVAGEASGDAHGAELLSHLKTLDPTLTFFGMGGPKLAAQGVELVHGSHEISVMGIGEVLPKIPRILRVLKDLVAEVEKRKPALAILIDVPDFNLRLAKQLKKRGIKVIWYIAPMVWAWRSGRTKIIAARTDALMCILPFEEAFLRERGVRATYVGNPVLDQVPAQAEPELFREKLGLDPAKPVLAILPGSRRSEIKRLLPVMVQVAKKMQHLHPGLQIAVPVAPGLEKAFISQQFEALSVPVTLLLGRAAEVVGASTIALVASGTATLEAGLMRRPMVVIYRVAWLTYFVGRAMVNLPFFSLINLLAKKQVVPELLQREVTVDRVVSELEALWQGPAREECLRGLDEVRETLGQPGASRTAAQLVASFIAPS